MAHKSCTATTHDENSPREQLMDLMFGAVRTSIIHCAASLDIADHLDNNAMTSDQLAVITKTNPQALHRLLRTLVSLGFLKKNEEQQFSVTHLGLLLKSDTPGGFKSHALNAVGPEYHAVGDLLHSIRTGEAAFDHYHGMSYFDYFNKKREMGDRYYKCLKDRTPATLATAYDFSQFNHVIDIGGGTGNLIIEILKKNPNLKGTVFDREYVSEKAKEHITENGLDDRCNFVTGSALESIPSGGDCYTIKQVLHDFSDEKAVEILLKIREQMKQDTKLLVIESFSHGDHEPRLHSLIDMTMLAMHGGRERSRHDYEEIFRNASLKLNNVFDVDNCSCNIIELTLG